MQKMKATLRMQHQCQRHCRHWLQCGQVTLIFRSHEHLQWSFLRLFFSAFLRCAGSTASALSSVISTIAPAAGFSLSSLLFKTTQDSVGVLGAPPKVANLQSALAKHQFEVLSSHPLIMTKRNFLTPQEIADVLLEAKYQRFSSSAISTTRVTHNTHASTSTRTSTSTSTQTSIHTCTDRDVDKDATHTSHTEHSPAYAHSQTTTTTSSTATTTTSKTLISTELRDSQTGTLTTRTLALIRTRIGQILNTERVCFCLCYLFACICLILLCSFVAVFVVRLSEWLFV